MREEIAVDGVARGLDNLRILAASTSVDEFTHAVGTPLGGVFLGIEHVDASATEMDWHLGGGGGVVESGTTHGSGIDATHGEAGELKKQKVQIKFLHYHTLSPNN